MSLINRVLRDLDERGAEPSPESQYSGGIRPVATQHSSNRRKIAIWLLAVSGAVVFALLVWPGGSGLKDFPAQLWAGRKNPPPLTIASIPAREPQTLEPVQARVEAALMVPVLQLSGELTTLPASASRAPAVSTNAEPVAVQKTAVKTTAVKTTAAQKSAVNKVPAKPSGSAASAESPTKAVVSKSTAAQRAQPKTAKSAQKGATERAGTAVKDRAVASAARPDEPLETIVIPADVPAKQIEKQARGLTSYERAEVAFREGVASLRRGRLDDAEAHFRAAINEDRSHAAAQQALVGTLIDAGRLEGAEDVLRESLDVNPRQPMLAMVLARLEVERGDLETAVNTLDRVSTYAGADANFLSFMAAVLQRAQRHEDAVVQYRNALALMPRNPVWLMGLGISLRELGESEPARQAFASAAAIGTLNADLQAFVERQQRELKNAVN